MPPRKSRRTTNTTPAKPPAPPLSSPSPTPTLPLPPPLLSLPHPTPPTLSLTSTHLYTTTPSTLRITNLSTSVTKTYPFRPKTNPLLTIVENDNVVVYAKSGRCILKDLADTEDVIKRNGCLKKDERFEEVKSRLNELKKNPISVYNNSLKNPSTFNYPPLNISLESSSVVLSLSEPLLTLNHSGVTILHTKDQFLIAIVKEDNEVELYDLSNFTRRFFFDSLLLSSPKEEYFTFTDKGLKKRKPEESIYKIKLPSKLEETMKSLDNLSPSVYMLHLRSLMNNTSINEIKSFLKCEEDDREAVKRIVCLTSEGGPRGLEVCLEFRKWSVSEVEILWGVLMKYIKKSTKLKAIVGLINCLWDARGSELKVEGEEKIVRKVREGREWRWKEKGEGWRKEIIEI
ncbi:hypothetical protein TL16_g07303 [Triparma laevis f. inornata]|uniref:Uncharacterized protein n=1 Tax=Triparma laevis f. inornata TaxID=1714386 RepID=A0A9W7AST7_9STRA|nr:hypothetical protein TL16_g07303 [Triparma laevis f. inornata]